MGIKKEITGTIEVISNIKTTKRANRFFYSIRVGDLWFNMFGDETYLEKTIKPLEIGVAVKVVYNENIIDSKTFREIVSIKKVAQVGLKGPPSTLIPVSESWSIIDNGVLSVKKLKMALKCLEVDCAFLIKELDKYGQIKEENHSD
jgi:hypothetical protein